MPFETSSAIVVRASRAAVWDALTKPELVKAYFFDTDLTTDWKVGSPLFFRGSWEGRTYEDRGTVLSFDPLDSLSYNYWSSFSGHEDAVELRHVVRFALTDASANPEEGVRLTVHQSNIDTRERAEHSRENWQTVLQALKRFVEERESP